MTVDPTLEFMRSLDDETKFKIKRGVPIFIPHERMRPVKDKDGKVVLENGKPKLKKVVVTEDDLEEICQNAAAREDDDTVGVITIGHRQLKPDFPETEQPPLVGYQKNLQVGRFGKKRRVGILADLHYPIDRYDEVKKYPHVSVDYHDGRKEITGLALLVREPELDLGMQSYGREEVCSAGTRVLRPTANDGTLIYQREVNMPDTIADPDPKVPLPPAEAAAAPNATPTPPEDPEAAQQYEKACGHMDRWMKDHPTGKKVGYMASKIKDDDQDYQAYAAGGGAPAAGGAVGGPTSDYVPGENGDEYDEETMQHQRQEQAEQYQKERDESQKQLKAERRAAAEEQIQYMRNDGYVVDDDDLNEIADLDPKARQAKIAKWRQQRRKAPLTPKQRQAATQQYARDSQVGVTRQPVEGATDPGTTGMTPEQTRAVVAFASAKGIRDFDEAKKRFAEQ